MLGRKKGPPVAEASAEAEWQVAEGTLEGRPIITRFNAAFAQSPDVGDYPIQIGIALPLNAANADGFPEEPEMRELSAAEQAIEDEAGDRAVLVGVITTGGMREFVLYTSTSDWIESFDHALQDLVPTHTVQVMAQRDPKWKTYRSFVK